MKKIIAITLTLVMIFVLSACVEIKEFQCSAVAKIEDSSSHMELVDTYIKLFESNTVITKIADDLDFEISNMELSDSIVIQEINYMDTIEIIVSYKDADQAKQILNALLEQYPAILKEYSSTLNFTVVSKSADDSE